MEDIEDLDFEEEEEETSQSDNENVSCGLIITEAEMQKNKKSNFMLKFVIKIGKTNFLVTKNMFEIKEKEDSLLNERKVRNFNFFINYPVSLMLTLFIITCNCMCIQLYVLNIQEKFFFPLFLQISDLLSLFIIRQNYFVLISFRVTIQHMYMYNHYVK